MTMYFKKKGKKPQLNKQKPKTSILFLFIAIKYRVSFDTLTIYYVAEEENPSKNIKCNYIHNVWLSLNHVWLMSS